MKWLTGTGSSRWSGSPVWTDRITGLNRITGRNEVPVSHCWLSFLASLTIVYWRIKKLSTDNSSKTLTQALPNLKSGQSTVMNINRYGRTYRNGILVAKFRVSHVKITRQVYPRNMFLQVIPTRVWISLRNLHGRSTDFSCTLKHDSKLCLHHVLFFVSNSHERVWSHGLTHIHTNRDTHLSVEVSCFSPRQYEL